MEDVNKTPKAAEERAVELMEAAAYAHAAEGRLWRLEWAQAFRRLADMGKKRNPAEKPKN